MSEVPRWHGLKHLKNVTTIDFTDGQTYLDILKVSCYQFMILTNITVTDINLQCVLPCIAQSIEKGSSLVACIRAYSLYRMMVGMHCMSDSRLERNRKYKTEYKKAAAVRSVLSTNIFCVIELISM